MAKTKARRKKALKPHIDSLTQMFLGKIRCGYVSEVGVLADWLEDHDHQLTSKVRELYGKWSRCVRGYREGREPRRNLTRWEEIAIWHQELRLEIGKLFGRKWDRLPLKKLSDHNAVLQPILKTEGDE